MKPLETIAYVSNHRFFFSDSSSIKNWDGQYENEPGEEGLGLAPGIVSILCSRSEGPVPVFLEIHSRAPELGPVRFCKIVEAPIEIESGELRILGEQNTEGEPGLEFSIEPGPFILRISFADLDTVRSGSDHGAEHYWLELYPMTELWQGLSFEVLRPYETLEQAITEDHSFQDVEALHWLAQDPSPSIRCSCIVALARQKQFKAVQHLALTDSSRCVRMVAVGALALMGARDYLEMVSDRETGLIGRTAQKHLNSLDFQ
jgi:hypothetical protein